MAKPSKSLSQQSEAAETMSDLPELRADHNSVQKVLTWSARALMTGELNERQVDVLQKLCRAMVNTIDSRHRQDELDELRSMAERMERDRDEIRAITAAARKNGILLDLTHDGQIEIESKRDGDPE